MWTFALSSPRSSEGPKRFLVWLRDRLATRDIPALGPYANAEGWILSVTTDDGMIFIRLIVDDGRPSEVNVDYVGEADIEAEDAAFAVETILNGYPAARLAPAAEAPARVASAAG